MTKTRWIVLGVAVLALAGAYVGTHGGGAKAAPDNAAPAAPQVTVAKVLVRPVAASAVYTGRLQAVNSVQVRARVSGYVESVHFTEGAMVHKGELLFSIDARPYQAEVDRLMASLADNRAALALARDNAARGKQLIAKHFISAQQFDALKSAATSAESQMAATRAQLRAARLNLSFTQVRAPIDGRISNVRITPGNLVTSSDVLTDLVSVDPLYAYFDVDEHSYLSLLGHGRASARGAQATGHAPVAMGLANESGFPHEGHIDFVDNQVDAGAGTIRLRAVFDNANSRLVPGLFARLRLETGAPHPTVLIDDRAVGTDLGNRFVYVVDASGHAQYRRIVPGPMYHGLRVVEHGLKAGERIVVDGLQRVQPGAQVTATQAPMTRHVGVDDLAALDASPGAGNTASRAAAR
ncbi:efflux RND transporter periplasmic adaptor subunit [Oleiagrimonas sp. C23AA]|uniref:efflux RND transporter periplasmic adaptor subunit n=1 Tax=Oleiagrimonas sp. C23AA TaxID=2719047 RepID=UPI00142437A8|nr:efflux RND transporter periplasmic adaptor subunit [Oleiagrimonas sp. C23AA]NII12332.1 efflux RND transporter periplasmic adaptor subunit [Oleiagrimonas sp. C23AA]